MDKYRRGKIKGETNFIPHTTTLSLIIIKRQKQINYGKNILSYEIYLELDKIWFKFKEMLFIIISTLFILFYLNSIFGGPNVNHVPI